MSQLELLAGPTVPPGTRLTKRQRRALELIAELGPIPHDELGAYFHRHGAGTRCQWCNATGREIGRALQAKNLVSMRREQGLTLAGDPPTNRDADASFGDFPDGF